MDQPQHSALDDGSVIFRYGAFGENAPFEVKVRCPLPSKLHPEHDKLREQHRSWAERFDIPPGTGGRERFDDTRLDLLAAYQCYDLPLTAAVLHSHLMTWFFVFDDVMDIDHNLDAGIRPFIDGQCRRHLDLLDGADATADDTRCIQAFADLLRQARSAAGTGGAAWLEQMKLHLREYVLGACWESLIGPTTDRNANTALYLQVRHMAVGVSPCLDLMSLSAGIPGEPVIGDLYVQRLERLAVNFSIWVNDLAGLNRDVQRGLGNVIFTLSKDHGLSLQEAARLVGRMCDIELDAFLRMEQQLPMLLGAKHAGGKAAFDAYAGVLKHWMRGLLDWSARSARYQRLDVNMALQTGRSIRTASRSDPPAHDP